jgi:hypothetical protein
MVGVYITLYSHLITLDKSTKTRVICCSSCLCSGFGGVHNQPAFLNHSLGSFASFCALFEKEHKSSIEILISCFYPVSGSVDTNLLFENIQSIMSSHTL